MESGKVKGKNLFFVRSMTAFLIIKEDELMSNDKLTAKEWHTKEAKGNFNGTWDLLDLSDRTEDQDFEMVHKAHASVYHWGHVGDALNQARGEWQVSRVYAVLGHGDEALYHGKKSLEICLENNYGDFDLAFGYEAVARAYKVLGEDQSLEKYLKKAQAATEAIGKKGDRDYAQGELEGLQN